MQQETEINNQKATRAMEAIAKAEEEKLYHRGLQDYVAGRRDTEEAQYYIAYWSQEQAVGAVAVQALAE